MQREVSIGVRLSDFSWHHVMRRTLGSDHLLRQDRKLSFSYERSKHTILDPALTTDPHSVSNSFQAKPRVSGHGGRSGRTTTPVFFGCSSMHDKFIDSRYVFQHRDPLWAYHSCASKISQIRPQTIKRSLASDNLRHAQDCYPPNLMIFPRSPFQIERYA